MMLAALLPVCVRVFAGQPASLSRADALPLMGACRQDSCLLGKAIRGEVVTLWILCQEIAPEWQIHRFGYELDALLLPAVPRAINVVNFEAQLHASGMFVLPWRQARCRLILQGEQGAASRAERHKGRSGHRFHYAQAEYLRVEGLHLGHIMHVQHHKTQVHARLSFFSLFRRACIFIVGEPSDNSMSAASCALDMSQ